jgi:outer membrane immunogenic protein
MKRLLFAGAMALAAATPALAADLPQAPPPPPPQAPAAYVPTVVPQYNWGGVYFGLNGGYGFGQSEFESTATNASSGSFSTDGGLFGVTAGANFQASSLVVGIEGDVDWTDIKGNQTSTTFCGGGTSCTLQTENDWLGTIRARVGYAWDRVLFYGTGGGAFGNIKPLVSMPGFALSTNNTEFGWTAGAGVEVALAENWTVRLEYLFVDLGKGTWSCSAALCGGTALLVPVSFDASLVRAGLDFKFNAF